jgi:hypothetical protein
MRGQQGTQRNPEAVRSSLLETRIKALGKSEDTGFGIGRHTAGKER